jgi:mRNA interferase RelE/StbE
MAGKAYTVLVDGRAAKEIAELERDIQRRIVTKIESLATNPRPNGVDKLKSNDDLYRVRVSDYRIIYQIGDRELIVLVVRVGHRREVYWKWKGSLRMARNVSIREARASFATIVNETAFGKERFVFTRNGKNIVALVPVEDLELIESIENKIDLEEARRRLAKPGKALTVAQLRKNLGLWI